MDNQKERELQRELERQLEEMGATIENSFRHGFEGQGENFSRSARGLAAAFRDVVRYGVEKSQATARPYDYGAALQEDSPEAGLAAPGAWQRAIVKKANWLFGTGLAMAISCGTIALGLFVGGNILSDLFAGWMGLNWLAELGDFMQLGGWICVVPTLCGVGRIKARTRLNLIANCVRERSSISLKELADWLDTKPKEMRQQVKKYIAKGWLPGWYNAKKDKLSFDAVAMQQELQEEAERAAAQAQQAERQQAAQAPLPEDQAQPKPEPTTASNIRGFLSVLDREADLMQEEQAREQLAIMHRTVAAIGDWIAQHPDKEGSARKLVSYYMPTTLKLLRTYNEVQGQSGENAETMRRDIAAMLHTLNVAYANLYDNLLSDMVMDVSTEIDVLNGMLHQDGLASDGTLQL